MKTKPFLYQLAALVVVAAIFYASYGATNALASARANVPEIYFAWERALRYAAASRSNDRDAVFYRFSSANVVGKARGFGL